MIITVTPENTNRRLDKFLFAYLNNAPHSFVYKMLRKKRIKLNGGRATGSELLREGDELRFFLSEETLNGCRKARSFAVAPPLTGIVFEDGDLLVVNKPAGLASMGGMKKKVGKSDHLLARCLYYLQESGAVGPGSDFTPALCNRLDVNTSGLVICGKNLHALQKINALFAARAVKKEYLAIVHGTVGAVGDTKILNNFFTKDNENNKVKVSANPPVSATDANIMITEYTVLAHSAGAEACTLLSVSPVTGRSHQIRAHLAFIGHPVMGDKKYGGRALGSASPTPPAYFLHCRRMELPGGTAFEAPPPENFSAHICRLF